MKVRWCTFRSYFSIYFSCKLQNHNLKVSLHILINYSNKCGELLFVWIYIWNHLYAWRNNITGNYNLQFFLCFSYRFVFSHSYLRFFFYSGKRFFFISYKEEENGRKVWDARFIGFTDDPLNPDISAKRDASRFAWRKPLRSKFA